MSVKLDVFATRDEWLHARESYIGGSDAACILNQNPWKSNVELWEEKTGRAKPADLSENPLVVYGVHAEEPLRELFRWDFPDMLVCYEENNMWTNDKYPFAHASLDGWLLDENGKKGVLEIKTATIVNSFQKAKWKDGIPQNYYVQVLHYLMVTEFDFAIVKAQLKFEFPGEELFVETRHYRIERKDVVDEIEYLAKKEEEFAECIKNDLRPSLILPEI